MQAQHERLYLYLRFALGIIGGGRCDGKTLKNLFYSTKTPLFGR